MQPTRQEILDHLRRQGQATVKELGEFLNLTSTGIRQHLTVLERDGLVEAREERGRVGRPALVYRAAIRFAAPYRERLEGRALRERVREANLIIGEHGCLAEFAQDGSDWLIHQYSCPFPNVARENSAVCILEVEFVRQLVGADARLVSSLLRGDRSCTYRVRKTASA